MKGLTRTDLELLAKALNHLKNFHLECDDEQLREYDRLEVENINSLAKRMKLDPDYFSFERS